MAKIHADRAKALVGIPFRTQGRDPAIGLDCAGLALVAFGMPPVMVRDDYRLRGDHRAEIEAAVRTHFRRVSRKQARPGDLIMMLAGPEQVHLAVLTPDGFVHADARRGHIVEAPGSPPWPVLAAYRRRVRQVRK